jgi:hypothetical protein
MPASLSPTPIGRENADAKLLLLLLLLLLLFPTVLPSASP